MEEQKFAWNELMVADPGCFAKNALGLEPTTQQLKFFEALAKPGARVAVRSGHGTGKSTALAASALWFLATRPGALVPCTAPTSHQLHDVLWREMRRLLGNMDESLRRNFCVTADKITLRGENGMIVGRTARPENPDALQGFHAEEILFIIDEAAGVNDKIFEVARGALSTESARVAMAGNPTRLSGYFHNAFHDARGIWDKLRFSCLDSPLVAPSYAEEIKREYGGDSDMYRVRVLGDFPRTGLFNLIARDVVEKAMTKQMPGDLIHDAPVVFGVDPAWLGTDRSAAVMRQGMVAKVLFVVRGVDTFRLAGLVARHADELSPDAIFVDQTGVGAGVYDQLKRTRHPVVGVSFAQTPLDADRFVNKRAEIWWCMREWLESGAWLEKNADLQDDLVTPEYHLSPNGKIQLESKDSIRSRGFASPDLGDALALTFAMPVYANRQRSRIQKKSEPYNIYGWMERN